MVAGRPVVYLATCVAFLMVWTLLSMTLLQDALDAVPFVCQYTSPFALSCGLANKARYSRPMRLPRRTLAEDGQVAAAVHNSLFRPSLTFVAPLCAGLAWLSPWERHCVRLYV